MKNKTVKKDVSPILQEFEEHKEKWLKNANIIFEETDKILSNSSTEMQNKLFMDNFTYGHSASITHSNGTMQRLDPTNLPEDIWNFIANGQPIDKIEESDYAIKITHLSSEEIIKGYGQE